ncbi:MAG TPA: SDR family NAD(P)-dependent oxidoreductase [Opitutus sp.]|nr:SDR family NAD(P)-dependent oxidoreductase [Opitutus sp.]
MRETKAGDAAPAPRATPRATFEPIAITGVAGFFPGCEDVAAFWRHLDRDESLLTPIPRERFEPAAGGNAGEPPAGWGGFIPDIASFDAGAFGILPLEAEEMDPRQRLLLMAAWRTLEDAGHDPRSLAKSNTGVFIACEGNEYAVLMSRAGFTPQLGFGQANSMVANRISYHFDFAGPSEVVDATCAGFAVALHRAVVALRAGLIDRAIVGAANLILLPDPFRFLGEAGQLSARNTVKSFGRDGDGFVRAEGVGTILVERSRDAAAAGRRAYAEIKHTAVNFNGQGGVSMASPNTEAHAALIKGCYREAGIDPRDLRYIEAQGMGSPVADIAEWTAINRALRDLCAERGAGVEPGFCRVSTLKPMLGHMHSASSLGALLKVIRSLQTGRIHRVLDFTEPNEHCDMQGTPCRIATATEDWAAAERPRLAAIHAYGSGGNNAHLLLEEARENRRPATDVKAPATGRVFQRERYWFRPATAPQAPTTPPDGGDAAVLAFVRKTLGLEAKAFDRDAAFTEMGLDSLSIGPFVARLETEFGVALRKSDVFSHATPARLAAHIGGLTRAGRSPARAIGSGEAKPAGHDDIAIIGMSLQVAGAENYEGFWQLLRDGRSAIAPLPAARWDGDEAERTKFRGGFLADVDAFDPLFFKISPKESERMDPRHRKLLQAAWAAIEDSGHSPDEWKGASHGIFIGIEESDYPYDEQSPITAVHGGTAPARIGYHLDTKGPVLAISTACSSSLVAVHYACRSILAGESDCALAGGCNILSQPARSFYALAQMGEMLSPDGTCYAFDRRANGMVIGEGVGLVVLKRLSQAVRDGDAIHAVIKGSGINYDGRTNGLTAPNGARQRELYERVYRQCGIEPAQISHVVAHGTGTSLGDPVEGNALIDAFGAGGGMDAWCALTSPKTNVGHTQAASGIVNLVAAALALRHGAIPPSLNYEEPNADIALRGSPFFVNTALREWRGGGRHAAVSSFGHTGTNAHVVLAAATGMEGDAAESVPARPALVVLSARSEERLRESARQMLEAPIAHLADAAYTLQVGRVAMEERLGIVASDAADLREKLRGYLAGETAIEGVVRGEARRDDAVAALLASAPSLRGSIDDWVARGQPVEVLKLWASGVDVDWHRLHGDDRPRRAHLPTYPFEKERYWLKTANRPVGAVNTSGGLASVTPDEPMEVLTFREDWVKSTAATRSADAIGTVACMVPDETSGRAWVEAMRGAMPAVEWIVVTPDASGGWVAALRNVAAAHAAIDALIYLRPFERPETLRDPASIMPCLGAVADAAPTARRLVLACPYRDDLERCHVDAWVAFERSLRPVVPATRVVVVGVRVNGTDVGADRRSMVAALAMELPCAEPESALHEDGQRLVRRIEPAVLLSTESRIKRGGTYLITGGMGRLGFRLAGHLAEKHSAKLVLTGRGRIDDAKAVRLEGLRQRGGEALYVAADSSDVEAMKAAIAEARARFGRIDGVIHAAGIEGSGSILAKPPEVFQAVLQAKVAGTLALDEALGDEPIGFIAYFSSSAAILGDFGSCDYAVANRFVTAYAHHRNRLQARGERQGRAAVINWPVWADGITGPTGEQTRFYLETSGQRALETAEGLALFERLLGQDAAQHLVIVGKPGRVRRFLGVGGVETKAQRVTAGARGRTPEHAGLSLEECVQADLRGIIGELLKIERAKLRLEANLADFGFDSISLAQLAERISAHFGVKITPALFFGYSTIQRLGGYFLAEHCAAVELAYARPEAAASAIDRPPAASLEEPAKVNAAGTRTTPATLGRDEPIAIIGMSGRFPQARSIGEMWAILAEGRTAVTEVPAERFDWREFHGDPARDKTKSNGKWMGCLPGVAEFDPLFFEISPREAEAMDPRQRHLLQEAWNALEDAGYGPRQIANHRVGVFVGVEEGDYAFIAPEGELTSNHGAILASRLAYLLDFRGPAMAINTACSSGLVAAHQACASLRNGECDAALVAGVSLQLTPAGHIAMGQAGMLSGDGTSYVFDQRANGMVPGEAAVALVLKRLAQAEADGDPICAVIRASGVNYDGRTNGITAPSGVAQAELLRGVYANARLDRAGVEYVVAHGTGTKLGDPVEVNALHTAFKDASRRRGWCALTSTKANFGHTFAASGLLSVVSLVEALRHELIPPSPHCERENDFITWEDSPFYVNKAAKAWPRRMGGARRGAVSAFGMSGTNAHMVIEDYAAAETKVPNAVPGYLIVLSGKTEEALRRRAEELAAALGKPEIAAAGLARVSYTLLEGRHHFEHRLAVVARDPAEAIAKLRQAVGGEFGPDVMGGRAPQDFGGQKAIRRHGETLLAQSGALAGDPEAYRDTLGALAELFCQGYDFSWRPLFGAAAVRRVSLPTYPFARETYWPEKKGRTIGGDAVARLHPLVHANTSDLGGQRFSSSFTGREFLFVDHRVRGEPVLPGVAYLEMARAALELSVPKDERTDAVGLRNVVWLRPLVANDVRTDVLIELSDADGTVAFEVCAGESGEVVTHAEGRMNYAGIATEAPLDLAILRARMSRGGVEPAVCYAAFATAGVEYGPAFQALRELLAGDGEVLARIALPESARAEAERLALHPALMDGALQATIALASGGESGARVPFALEELTAWGALPATAWVWARRSPGGKAGDETERFDLDLFDDAGAVRLRMRGLAMRRLATGKPARETKVFPRILTGAEFFLADHGGLLPGVVSLEWARSAGRLALGRTVGGLKNVIWNRPLQVETGSREVRTVVATAGDGFAYEVVGDEGVHAQGTIFGAQPADARPAPLPLAELRARCRTARSAAECEALVEARLGERMRSVAGLWHGDDEALAELTLPEAIAETAGEFILHPSLLNGALQAANVLARIEHPGEGAPTPFGIEALRIFGAAPAKAIVHAKKRGETSSGPGGARLSRYDLVVADREGTVAIVIEGYAALATKKLADGETLFAVADWKASDGGPEARPTANSADPGAEAMFVLTEATAGLREAIARRWPQAAIEIAAAKEDDAAMEPGGKFAQVLRLVQAELRQMETRRRPVLLLAAEPAEAELAAACAGLFRTARMERGGFEAKVIRLRNAGLASPDIAMRTLAAELARSPDDVDVRWSGDGRREVRTLRELTPVPATRELAVRAGAVIWITGGLGGIGRALARHLGAEGKARVFLSGRSRLDDAKRAFLRELGEQGADVRYLEGDVARAASAGELVQKILAETGRLDGVIHAAGVIEDALLAEKTLASLERVWRPKVAGARAIDAATREVALEFMAFCSSLTGTFGNAGQADYAGANAFLDAFAAERNRLVAAGERSGRTVSVAWPLWREGGMLMDEQNELLLKQRSGMTPMATSAGIAALHRALRGEAAHVLVLHGDAERMREKLLAGGDRPADAPQAAAAEGRAAEVAVDAVQAELRRIVAEQQKIAPEKIEPDVELPRYGFDSIRLTELANRLNRAWALDLMPTLFFEHTTLRAIARHLVERHPDKLAAALVREQDAGGRRTTPAAAVAKGARGRRRKAPERTAQAPIAIVGLSGRFPGSADIDEFWRHLEANHDLIGEVPAERWDWREIYGDAQEQPGKTKVKCAGFMAGVDEFDPAFFGISPREAASMDPQFRLLLETVWATIEDAGYRASELAGTRTGVFVGVSTSDYKDAWLRRAGENRAGDGPALVSHFVIANRISYALDLRGPSEPIDTACSSSLIAIHRAIEAMRLGHCEQAIVGGVNVICTPDITIGASRAGMLSEDGRCKTFDKDADGYGRGEGVGALLLKPFDAALRDGDHVYALVRGSAENHGGKAQSPTAPNPAAQRDLLVAAYTRAEVDPRTVGYIEAHGTGTSLGDPIEIEGLTGAFAELYRRAGASVGAAHCGVGSVKTNVGHLEAAAGIAGVVKVVMMLRHRKLPGNVHLREPNPYLRLEGTPFYLARETRDWPAPRDEHGRTQPRRAGVSSFGIGGSNAHVILEEYAADSAPATGSPGEPRVFVLSARHAERLTEIARKLRDFLRRLDVADRPTPGEIAFTLQTGREAMEERLGFVATTFEELLEKLDALADGRGAVAGVQRGRVSRRAKEAATDGSHAAAGGESGRAAPAEVIAHWVHGAEIDWRARWTDAPPRRVRLPSYPFARNRYWFDMTPDDVANASVAAAAPDVPAAPGVSAPDVREKVETFLVASLAKILYLAEDAIDRGASFIDLGLDSVLGVEWVQSIKSEFGIRIPATKVYDHPTVAAFAAFLADELARAGKASIAMPPAAASAALTLDDILERVRAQRMSVDEADRLIDELDLDEAGEEEATP